MEQFDITSVLAAINAQETELALVSGRLAASSSTAQSQDGMVEVSVGGMGTVQSVHFVAEVFRHSSPQYLGNSVAEAAQQAARRANRTRSEILEPIAVARRELLHDRPPTGRGDVSGNLTVADAEATSTDGTALVRVGPMGVVSAVFLSPSAFHVADAAGLATAITEAAQRAARVQFGERSSAWEPFLRESDENPWSTVDLDELFPVSDIPAPPVAVQPTAARGQAESASPSSLVGHVIPGTRKPNRDLIVNADQPDDDDLYYQERRQKGWLV